jgi:hypothetical protein
VDRSSAIVYFSPFDGTMTLKAQDDSVVILRNAADIDIIDKCP